MIPSSDMASRRGMTRGSGVMSNASGGSMLNPRGESMLNGNGAMSNGTIRTNNHLSNISPEFPTPSRQSLLTGNTLTGLRAPTSGFSASNQPESLRSTVVRELTNVGQSARNGLSTRNPLSTRNLSTTSTTPTVLNASRLTAGTVAAVLQARRSRVQSQRDRIDSTIDENQLNHFSLIPYTSTTIDVSFGQPTTRALPILEPYVQPWIVPGLPMVNFFDTYGSELSELLALIFELIYTHAYDEVTHFAFYQWDNNSIVVIEKFINPQTNQLDARFIYTRQPPAPEQQDLLVDAPPAIVWDISQMTGEEMAAAESLEGTRLINRDDANNINSLVQLIRQSRQNDNPTSASLSEISRMTSSSRVNRTRLSGMDLLKSPTSEDQLLLSEIWVTTDWLQTSAVYGEHRLRLGERTGEYTWYVPSDDNNTSQQLRSTPEIVAWVVAEDMDKYCECKSMMHMIKKLLNISDQPQRLDHHAHILYDNADSKTAYITAVNIARVLDHAAKSLQKEAVTPSRTAATAISNREFSRDASIKRTRSGEVYVGGRKINGRTNDDQDDLNNGNMQRYKRVTMGPFGRFITIDFAETQRAVDLVMEDRNTIAQALATNDSVNNLLSTNNTMTSMNTMRITNNGNGNGDSNMLIPSSTTSSSSPQSAVLDLVTTEVTRQGLAVNILDHIEAVLASMSNIQNSKLPDNSPLTLESLFQRAYNIMGTTVSEQPNVPTPLPRRAFVIAHPEPLRDENGFLGVASRKALYFAPKVNQFIIVRNYAMLLVPKYLAVDNATRQNINMFEFKAQRSFTLNQLIMNWAYDANGEVINEVADSPLFKYCEQFTVHLFLNVSSLADFWNNKWVFADDLQYESYQGDNLSPAASSVVDVSQQTTVPDDVLISTRSLSTQPRSRSLQSRTISISPYTRSASRSMDNTPTRLSRVPSSRTSRMLTDIPTSVSPSLRSLSLSPSSPASRSMRAPTPFSSSNAQIGYPASFNNSRVAQTGYSAATAASSNQRQRSGNSLADNLAQQLTNYFTTPGVGLGQTVSTRPSASRFFGSN